MGWCDEATDTRGDESDYSLKGSEEEEDDDN